MPKRNYKRGLKIVGTPALFFVGGMLIWEFLIILLSVPEWLLPKPSAILFELITNFKYFLYHVGITMSEAVSGYLIACVLAFVTAIIFVHSETAERGLYPYVLTIKVTPTLAIVPFLIMWFGIGITPKIITAALICFFPILVNTVKGLKTIDEETLDLFKSLSATKWQIFTKLMVPNSLPYVFPALKTATVLAVVGAFVGEYVGANEGIGYLILISTHTFESTTTFGAIIISALAGILFFSLLGFMEKKVVFWQKS